MTQSVVFVRRIFATAIANMCVCVCVCVGTHLEFVGCVRLCACAQYTVFMNAQSIRIWAVA